MAPIDDYSSSWQDFASTIKPDVDVERKINFKKLRRNGCDFTVNYEANAACTTAKAIDKSSPYIRNFTTQMRAYSPELNEFFDDFALDIVKPASISWEDAEDGVRYETKYICRGSMNQELFEHNVRKVKIVGKAIDADTVEFTMSNLVLARVVMELREIPAAPEEKGILGKLKNRFKK